MTWESAGISAAIGYSSHSAGCFFPAPPAILILKKPKKIEKKAF
jgi:hypothetical protein